MGAVVEAVDEGFVFVGHTDPAAKVEYRIGVIQGQNFQVGFQFLEAFPDTRRIAFVGFCVGAV